MFLITLELHHTQNRNTMSDSIYSTGALATVKTLWCGVKVEGINNKYCSSGHNGDATAALLSTAHNNFKRSGVLSHLTQSASVHGHPCAPTRTGEPR